MVAVLGVPLMVAYDKSVVQAVIEGAKKFNFPLPETFKLKGIDGLWVGAIILALVLIIWAVWQSKRQSPEMSQMTKDAEA
jgi:Na+/H+ antiporter NhaC